MFFSVFLSKPCMEVIGFPWFQGPHYLIFNLIHLFQIVDSTMFYNTSLIVPSTPSRSIPSSVHVPLNHTDRNYVSQNGLHVPACLGELEQISRQKIPGYWHQSSPLAKGSLFVFNSITNPCPPHPNLSTLCHTVCCRLTIGNGRGSGFVNDSQNVHSGDGAGILGGLTLGIVEVGWYRDLGSDKKRKAKALAATMFQQPRYSLDVGREVGS